MQTRYFLSLIFIFGCIQIFCVEAKKCPHECIYTKNYLPGFTSLKQELSYENLQTSGTIPQWLHGSIFQCGPGKFEVGSYKIKHWFDGFGLLHRFTFNNGAVSYANKFIQSKARAKSLKHKKICFIGFADTPEKSLFKKIFSFSDPSDHAISNVYCLNNTMIALSDLPKLVRFNSQTLATDGEILYKDSIQGHLSTSHAHIDYQTNELFNYVTNFSLKSSYQLFKLDLTTNKRHLITTLPIENPSYMHSFALTKNYCILTHLPYTTNAFSLLMNTKSFLKNLTWNPKKDTIFYVINRHSGKLVGSYKHDSFFMLHHVNAFEENQTIVIDIATYKDPSIIDSFHLFNIHNEKKLSHFPGGKLKRFTLDLSSKSLKEKLLSETTITNPHIYYQAYNMQKHTYVYGIHASKSDDFYNHLIKINIETKEECTWHEDGCYPSEPIFINQSNSESDEFGDQDHEDRGLIASVVLDTKNKNSFLLLLNATTFEEIGRAIVPTMLPFTMHGNFFAHEQ